MKKNRTNKCLPPKAKSHTNFKPKEIDSLTRNQTRLQEQRHGILTITLQARLVFILNPAKGPKEAVLMYKGF